MALLKINGISYDTETLSEEIKDHLRHIAHIDAEFERLTMQLDVLRIARTEIGNRLDRELIHAQINEASYVATPPAAQGGRP